MPIQDLAEGFSASVDTVDEQSWYSALGEFEDANLYQTWAYGEVIAGPRNTSRLVLKKDGVVVGMAQARIMRLPFLSAGIAYILWGPVWKRPGASEHVEFRQTVRALRNEYACRRGLTLRFRPRLVRESNPSTTSVLHEEGVYDFELPSSSRTILLDLSPTLMELREGMKAHWQRELKLAERNLLHVYAGTGEDEFGKFVNIYREMVTRKRFTEPNDIDKFRLIQRRLPEPFRMNIALCNSGNTLCAGAIYSTIGNTALYLFGATSNAGMKSRGSYLLQWKILEDLKSKSVSLYDLNGINPVANPGTYKFKSDLAGRHGIEACYLPPFEARGSFMSQLSVAGAELARSKWREIRDLARNPKMLPGVAQ